MKKLKRLVDQIKSGPKDRARNKVGAGYMIKNIYSIRTNPARNTE